MGSRGCSCRTRATSTAIALPPVGLARAREKEEGAGKEKKRRAAGWRDGKELSGKTPFRPFLLGFQHPVPTEQGLERHHGSCFPTQPVRKLRPMCTQLGPLPHHMHPLVKGHELCSPAQWRGVNRSKRPW